LQTENGGGEGETEREVSEKKTKERMKIGEIGEQRIEERKRDVERETKRKRERETERKREREA
jgi:hypothetical protein